MSSFPRVALIGAAGSVGSAVLQRLLAANYSVTILTREGSTSTSKLPSHVNQTIKEVDYKSKEALTAAIEGSQVVISTVANDPTGNQDILVDAALATGTVTRFIPSEFGVDIHHPANSTLPIFPGKIAVSKHLESIAASNPSFTYTNIETSAFLDWGLENRFIIDPFSRKATLFDGGDVPISATNVSTIADAVLAVLENLEGTKNRTFKIHDAVVTQNQLIEFVKKVDGGQQWTTEVKDVEVVKREAYEEFGKPEPNKEKAVIGFICAAIFGPASKDYSMSVDNKALGLKELTMDEVQEVVRKVLQG